MQDNNHNKWSGVPPHLHNEFNAEALQRYLTNLGYAIPVELFSQVDVEFYRKTYAEELPPNSDPVEFFFEHGWTLGHQPNQWFATDFYLIKYGDVHAALVNPFEHFLIFGHRENRFPASTSQNKILNLLNKRSAIDPWHHSDPSMDDLPLATLDQISLEISNQFFPDSQEVVVALGHDSYKRQIGGIQIIVGIEQLKFASEQTNYVSIFPVQPRLALYPELSIPRFQAIVNGNVIPLSFELGGLLKKIGGIRALIVHSIFGHNPELIKHEISTSRISEFIWWIHDYSIHCENHLLTHNNLRACRDPALNSQLCLTCIHGSRRRSHVERIQNLLNCAPWRFIAPSQTAQEISVLGATRIPKPEIVPHGEVIFDSHREPIDSYTHRLRIAFVGHPIEHKGWAAFQLFVDFSSARGLAIDFFHFGSVAINSKFITYVELLQTSATIGLTTAQLRQHQIDAVFIWSAQQETFNLVTYESIAAGCVVITRRSSGNIAAAANHYERAFFYEDEDDLLSDKNFVEKIRQKISNGLPTGLFAFTGTSFAVLECEER